MSISIREVHPPHSGECACPDDGDGVGFQLGRAAALARCAVVGLTLGGLPALRPTFLRTQHNSWIYLNRQGYYRFPVVKPELGPCRRRGKPTLYSA